MSKSFSVDWFSSNIPYLQEYLAPIAGHPHIHALEVGSFEGRSTTWFLDTILTHPTSHITCVDTFKGSPEHEGVVETDSLLQRFSSNIKRYQNVNRITVFQQTSEQFFIQNVSKMQGKFDFIYIDGSHKACDVLTDAVFSIRLLKNGGYLIFDDYNWPHESEEIYKPKIAVDSFIKCFEDQCKVLHIGDICIMQKV